jgi:ribonuclease HI
VDGSSQVIEGKRHNGYFIVEGEALTIIESGQLPNNWSVQTCELFALNQVLKHLKDKEGTIYTDSKYAFGVVHAFGKIWMEQGLINSKGQDLVHGELIQQILILESLKLPKEIAIVHVPRHQKGINFEAWGNCFADETVKQASLAPEVPVFCLIPYLTTPPVTLSLSLLRKNN